MGRIKLYRMISVLWIGLVLSACSAAPRVADYRRSGFRGEVAWENEGVQMVALAEVSAPVAGSARTVTLTLTSPPALAGVVLMGSADSAAPVRVVCGEMTVENAELGTLWEIMELLLPQGSFRSVCRTEEGLIYGEIVPTKEEENGDVRYGLYLEPNSGAPRRIVCGERKLELVSFEVVG